MKPLDDVRVHRCLSSCVAPGGPDALKNAAEKGVFLGKCLWVSLWADSFSEQQSFLEGQPQLSST